MTLEEYLQERSAGKRAAVALSRAEAGELGIPWPLEQGWRELHGGRPIDEAQLTRLREWSARYRQRLAQLF